MFQSIVELFHTVLLKFTCALIMWSRRHNLTKVTGDIINTMIEFIKNAVALDSSKCAVKLPWSKSDNLMNQIRTFRSIKTKILNWQENYWLYILSGKNSSITIYVFKKSQSRNKRNYFKIHWQMIQRINGNISAMDAHAK